MERVRINFLPFLVYLFILKNNYLFNEKLINKTYFGNMRPVGQVMWLYAPYVKYLPMSSGNVRGLFFQPLFLVLVGTIYGV